MKNHHLILIVASIIVICALAYAFIQVGGPNKARDMKFDSTRVSNLYSIKSSVNSYYSQNKKLPDSLSQLEQSYLSSKKDPETNEEYIYSVVDTTRYKLCATFATSNLEPSEQKSTYDYSDYYKDFRHPKGNHCFTLTAYESRYDYYISPTPSEPRKPFLVLPTSNQTLCLKSTTYISWTLYENPDEILLQIEEPKQTGKLTKLHTIIRIIEPTAQQSKSINWVTGVISENNTKLPAGDNYTLSIQALYKTSQGTEQHLDTKVVNLKECSPSIIINNPPIN